MARDIQEIINEAKSDSSSWDNLIIKILKIVHSK